MSSMIRYVKHILGLVGAVMTLSACDPYSAWGPDCVYATDMFRMAVMTQVNANNPQWKRTSLYALPGETIEFTLFDNATPITLCGKQSTSIGIAATQSNWTTVFSDVHRTDRIDLHLGHPSAAVGTAGNRWSIYGLPEDGPPRTPLPSWQDSAYGVDPTHPNYRYEYTKKPDGTDAGTQGNPACVGMTGSDAPCWDTYGKSGITGDGWRYRVGSSGGGTLIATPSYPGYTGDPEGPSTPDNLRGLFVIPELGDSGDFQIRLKDPGAYSNNQGGMTFNIDRYGCMIDGGKDLEIAIGPRDISSGSADPNNSSFTGEIHKFLELDDLAGTDGTDSEGRIVKQIITSGERYEDRAYDDDPTEYFKSEGGGLVWVRILDEGGSGDGDGEYGDIDIDPGPGENFVPSNNGNYKLQMVTRSTMGNENNYISDVANLIVDEIKTVLKQVQQTVFNGVISGDFGNFVRAILTLYIALYGAAFMAGLIQTPQFDFMIRMFKVAIVMALIHPNAWEFFNDHLFKLFTDGTAYIINLLNNLTSGTIADWGGDATIDFSMLDLTVGKFVTQSFWVKVISLLFAGPFGWLYIIAIIYAVIVFTKAVLLALISYIMALVAMAVLVGTSPIFIIFLLFEQTKNVFEGWVQEMVNYSVRPILIFTVLTVFNYLMFAILAKIMGFNACWKCILNFTLPLDFLPRFCVFYFYQPVAYDNLDDLVPSVYMPVTVLNIIALVIVAKMTDKFIPFAEDMARNIVGSTAGASLIGVAGSTVQSAIEAPGNVYDGVKKIGSTAKSIYNTPKRVRDNIRGGAQWVSNAAQNIAEAPGDAYRTVKRVGINTYNFFNGSDGASSGAGKSSVSNKSSSSTLGGGVTLSDKSQMPSSSGRPVPSVPSKKSRTGLQSKSRSVVNDGATGSPPPLPPKPGSSGGAVDRGSGSSGIEVSGPGDDSE